MIKCTIPLPTESSESILNSDIEDFVTHLRAAGYARRTWRKKRSVARAFARWSWRRKWTVAALDESHLDKFLGRPPRRSKARRAFESAALVPFLEHLRRTGRSATRPPPAPPTSAMELERRYVDFLRSERGLADRSVRVYAPYVHAFLLHWVDNHGSATPSKLNVAMVQRFLLDRAQGRSAEWVRLLAVALRSLFRFFYWRGETDRDLSACVPTVRKWSQATVPACLSPEEVEQALGAPDRSVAQGRRDYAMLSLLARLGLRAGEIVALELADIHWRTGEITIRGKGKQLNTLPLPADVGQAIANYLRADRGASTSRQVFLRTYAPRVGLTDPGAIGHIVRRVLAQAGIRRRSRGAAHLFRHSLASQMIQHGASLNEISEVLRHQSQNTTEIYAKVDLRSLREVARPWPCTGGAQ